MSVTLQEVLFREFGVKTTFRTNPLTDTVAITPTKILSNNPNRLAMVIVNLGANDCVIDFNVEVALLKGILLANSGGGISFRFDTEFNLLESGVWAIASVAPTTVYVLEVVTMPIDKQPFAGETGG